jgi:hypothetical protein
MGTLIPVELYQAMVISGPPGEVGRDLHRRYGDLFDRVSINAPYDLAAEVSHEVARSFRQAQALGEPQQKIR